MNLRCTITNTNPRTPINAIGIGNSGTPTLPDVVFNLTTYGEQGENSDALIVSESVNWMLELGVFGVVTVTAKVIVPDSFLLVTTN
jgi:hypothetical protein